MGQEEEEGEDEGATNEKIHRSHLLGFGGMIYMDTAVIAIDDTTKAKGKNLQADTITVDIFPVVIR